MFVCLFEFFVPMKNFPVIWRRDHCLYRAAKFDLFCLFEFAYSSSEGSLACYSYCDTEHPFFMVISKDQWHTPISECLAGELPLPVFTTYDCRGWDSHIQPYANDANTNVLTGCANAYGCTRLPSTESVNYIWSRAYHNHWYASPTNICDAVGRRCTA